MAARVVHSDGLVFVLQHRELTLEDAHEIVRRFGETAATGRPYLVVSDARGVAVPSARVRTVLGSSDAADPVKTRQGYATAVLIDSTLLRGAVTSVGWFLSKRILKPFESGAEALGFLEQQALQQRIELTNDDRSRLAALDRLWRERRPCTEPSDWFK